MTPVYDVLGRVDTLTEVTLLGTRVTGNDYDLSAAERFTKNVAGHFVNPSRMRAG